MSYHINPKTGRVGQCRAKTPESCQFSQDAKTVVAHFENKEDAQKAYERMNETFLNRSPRISKSKKNSDVTDKMKNEYKVTLAQLEKTSYEALRNFNRIAATSDSLREIDKMASDALFPRVKALEEVYKRTQTEIKVHEKTYKNVAEAVEEDRITELARNEAIRNQRMSSLSCGSTSGSSGLTC